MKVCRIRKAMLSDCKAILDIYKTYILEAVSTFEYEVLTLTDFTKRTEKIMQTYPYLVYEEDGVILGYAYAGAFKERAAYQWDVELSIYLKKGYSRKGIGKALYQKLFEVLKEQGIVHAYACVTIPNPNSIALHKLFGFETVGIFHHAGYKFDTWHDILWLEKTLCELPTKPKAIRSINEIVIEELRFD